MINNLVITDICPSSFQISFSVDPSVIKDPRFKTYLRGASEGEASDETCWTRKQDGSFLFSEVFSRNPVSLACRGEIERISREWNPDEEIYHSCWRYLTDVTESLAPHWY